MVLNKAIYLIPMEIKLCCLSSGFYCFDEANLDSDSLNLAINFNQTKVLLTPSFVNINGKLLKRINSVIFQWT
jgi:hypothetical protein